MCASLWFITTVVFATLFGFAVSPSAKQLAARLSSDKVDALVSHEFGLAPESYRQGCPPMTYMDSKGRCLGNWGYFRDFKMECNPNTLDPMFLGATTKPNLYEYDETSSNVGGCVPLTFEDGTVRTLADDRLTYYTRWMVGGMSSYLLNHTKPFHIKIDLSQSNYAVHAASKTSINDAEWDTIMETWITRSKFLPDGYAPGVDYHLLQTPGAAPITGYGLFGMMLDLFMKNNDMTKFCIFHNIPGYPGMSSYAEEGVKWFVAESIKQSPTQELKMYWAQQGIHMMPGGHGWSTLPPAMHDGTAAIQYKAWSRHSGLPKPTCTGADGVEYALDSTSPTSPWVQYAVFPGNPDGYEGDAQNRFDVPGDRMAVDMSYNMYWAHAKVGRTRAQQTFAKGSDGVPANVVWTSTTKGMGHAGMRNGFLATRSKDLRDYIMNNVGMWYAMFSHSTLQSDMQKQVFGELLMPAEDGTPSEYEQALIDWHKEVDGKIYDVMKTCKYLEVTNPIVDGEFLGATMWVQWKPAYLKKPGTELYLNLWQYLLKYANIRSRAAKYCPAGGKLYTAAAAKHATSAWHGYDGYEEVDGCLGDDDWGQGANAGDAKTWARYTRMFTAQTPDRDYAEGWTARLQKVCDGHVGAPLTLAETDPTLLVDETVRSGFN